MGAPSDGGDSLRMHSSVDDTSLPHHAVADVSGALLLEACHPNILPTLVGLIASIGSAGKQRLVALFLLTNCVVESMCCQVSMLALGCVLLYNRALQKMDTTPHSSCCICDASVCVSPHLGLTRASSMCVVKLAVYARTSTSVMHPPSPLERWRPLYRRRGRSVADL